MATKRTSRIIGVASVAALLVAGAVYFALAFAEVGKHKDKLWLHRCNSIEKLNEKYGDYTNVEVDVCFRDTVLDVTHDLDKSFGLSIEEYFAFFARREGKMWLDVKNLTSANRDSVLAELTRLTKRYGVDRSRLIVESHNHLSLRKLTQEGFYTSYYVDFPPPPDLSADELNRCVDTLRAVADSGDVRAISFPGWWYSTISKRLDRDIDLLTWEHRKTQLVFFLIPGTDAMLNDNRLKVILIKDKGNYHR
ncbi:MAG: hypothetical protein ACI31D_02375 [Candidatus Limisoma sp.]